MGGATQAWLQSKHVVVLWAWLNKHGRLQGKKQDFPFSFSSSFRGDQSCSYH